MKSRTVRRRGFFLVIVLIVIAVATMAVYSFTELMIAYDDSAYLACDIVQTRVNVESGAETIRLILSQPPDIVLTSVAFTTTPRCSRPSL